MISGIESTDLEPMLLPIETKEPPFELSYLFRLQNLINQMTAQLGRLSEESHHSMATKKKEYRISSEKAAVLHEDLGKIGPYGTGAGLALTATAFAVVSCVSKGYLSPESTLATFAQNKELVTWIKDVGINQGVGVYLSYGQAKEQRYNSTAAIRQTDIQNEGNKSGDTVSISTALGELSRSVLESLKRASG